MQTGGNPLTVIPVLEQKMTEWNEEAGFCQPDSNVTGCIVPTNVCSAPLSRVCVPHPQFVFRILVVHMLLCRRRECSVTSGRRLLVDDWHQLGNAAEQAALAFLPCGS